MAAMGTTVHCASEVTAEDGKRKEFPERQTGITEINRQGDYLVEDQAL